MLLDDSLLFLADSCEKLLETNSKLEEYIENSLAEEISDARFSDLRLQEYELLNSFLTKVLGEDLSRFINIYLLVLNYVSIF